MRYKLETQHFINDQLLEAGTEIGDGTGIPLYEGFNPGSAMEPLDDEAKEHMKKYASKKENFGRSPEEMLPVGPVTGDNHPIENPSTINRNPQPIIPPPLEHLTKPNDMKPGEVERANPVLTKALQDERDRLAGERDKDEARKANAHAKELAVSHGAKEARDAGQGPKGPPTTVPGQGPAQRPTGTPNLSGTRPASVSKAEQEVKDEKAKELAKAETK